ncbi:MAG: hypothetical protein WBA63_02135 [Thermomicrobiales bacterium]
MNRRQLLGSVLSGASLGSVWSCGLAFAMRRRDPTIEVIGADDSQVALISVERVRVLVLMGSPSRSVRDHLDGLIGTFRPRVDLLIGSRSGIDLLGPEFQRQRHVSHKLALDDDSAPYNGTPLASPPVLSTRLSGDVTMSIRTLTMRGWNTTSTERRSWLVIVQRGNHTAVLGPNIDDVAMFGPATPTLALGATGSIAFAARKLPATALGYNADGISEDRLGALSGTAQRHLVRIHPGESAVFTISNAGVRLPSWAEQRSIQE